MIQSSLLPLAVTADDWRPPTPPELRDVTDVYLDVESTGTDWARGDRPVGYALRAAGRSYYLPFGHKGGGNLDEATVKRWAQTELRNKRISNHTTSFDVLISRAWGVDLAAQGCTFHDVSHSAALLDDHRKEFNLEVLSQDRLGEGKVALPFAKGDIANAPAGVVAPYAMRDVELVERLRQSYAPDLHAEGLERVSALEDDVIPVVCEMQWNGVKLNTAKLAEWLEKSEAIRKRMLWDIYKSAGFQVNPNSVKDMTRLFQQRGISIAARTATGAPSFTAEVMRGVQDEVVQAVYRLGKLDDLRTKFLIPYSQAVTSEGKIRCTFNQLRTDEGGTVSGRFSAVRPNLQQVMKPKKQRTSYGLFEGEAFIIKELFVPEHGLWGCFDQEQVEFRLLGHYANARKIIDTYAAEPRKEGKVWVSGPRADFHTVVTKMIQTANPDMERDGAKNANFARVYGSGVAKFAAMTGMEYADALQVLDTYDREFPEAKQLLNQAAFTAETRGYVKTLFGRRSRFPNAKRTHKALNAVIQGTAADLNKLTLVDVYRNRADLGITLRLTVHDEIDGDVPSAEQAQRINDFLDQQRVDLRVPILWAGGTAKNWAEAKD